MNLIGGYQQVQHHLMHEAFPFAQRCHLQHQDAAPYFHGWVAPELPFQGPYPAGAELQAPAASRRERALRGLPEGLAPPPPPPPGLGLGLGSGCAQAPRRASGPKKERRRTESINTAFAELRECIPNVPADTKLSKIKTLRLATSYIAYLMDVLAKDAGETEGFKAEIKKLETRDLKRKRDAQNEGPPQDSFGTEKKVKGRTGWPQQVWALELNQ